MIFLDTGFLYALVIKRDENHARVLEVMRRYHDRDLRKFGLTTNHVIEETITLIKASGHRDPGLAHDAAVVVGASSTLDSSAGSTR